MTIVKNEIWDIIKRNFGIILVGTVFIIMYFSGCGGRGGGETTKSDTTSKTVTVVQPIVVNPPYTPQQQGNTVYVPIPQSAQGVIPASTIEGLVAQVKDLSSRIEALGQQYYAVKHYEDSIQLKDTAGKRVGVVNLKQTVSENTLKSTQPSYQLSFPHTITTITNTVYPKPRNQVFAGGSVSTLFNNPTFQMADIGVLLKNKKDGVVALSATYDFPNNSPGARVGFYKIIRLKPPRFP
jgi:hypothetical protein